MLTLGPSSSLSPDKVRAETVCSVKSKSTGPTGSLPEDNFPLPCCDSTTSGERDGDLPQLCSFEQQANNQPSLASTACASGSDSRELSPASITNCSDPSERNQARPILPRGPGQRCRYEQQEPLGDVVEYIIRELQGISRLQSEIAELQQHLNQVQGSVDEVSSCVDSVLSEIEGLHVGSSSLGKVCSGEKAQELHVERSREEAILYLYGLPEHDGENTMELVDNFLAKHLCVNGMQCNRYIQEAYRTGTAPAPRPTVVKLVHLEHRDLILQKSILLQSVGVRVATREEPVWSEGCEDPPKESLSCLQQLQDHSWNSLNQDKPALRLETGNRKQMTEPHQIRTQNQQRGPQASEHQGPRLLPKDGLAKQSDVSKLQEEVKGTSGASWVTSDCCGELSLLHPLEGSSSVLISKEEDCEKLQIFKQGRQEHEACKVTKLQSDCSNSIKDSSCLSLSGPLKADMVNTEDKMLGCEAGLDILSPKQLEDLLADKSRRFATLSPDSTMEEVIIGPETLSNMVHIDLNEEENCTAQVLKDVFDKSSRVLADSQEDEDVEIKFHTTKLSRAIQHFRLALQGVFQKLENNGSISPEDLESNESGSQSENSDRLLWTVSSGGAHDCSVESPASQGSESLLSVVSGGVGISIQGDQTSQAPSNFSLASNNSPFANSLLSFPLAPCLGSETCSRPDSPNQGKLSLEQVCAETIYLNKCINNFKNVLREKRLRQKKLLQELVQTASHLSVEDIPSGTLECLCNVARYGIQLHCGRLNKAMGLVHILNRCRLF
jgi:hypothetical protein